MLGQRFFEESLVFIKMIHIHIKNLCALCVLCGEKDLISVDSYNKFTTKRRIGAKAIRHPQSKIRNPKFLISLICKKKMKCIIIIRASRQAVTFWYGALATNTEEDMATSNYTLNDILKGSNYLNFVQNSGSLLS